MTIVDEFLRDPERVLDRLVDGELPPVQRSELLAALDDEPGGWRRCALAFLEAQSWHWQLSRVAAEPLLAQASNRAPQTRSRKAARWSGGFLAIAASVAVAFVVGTRFPTTGEIAQPERRAAAPPHSIDRSTALAQVDEAGAPNWQTVTLTPANGSGKPIEVRVANETQSAAAVAPRASLSGLLAQGFETAGFQVNRRQGIVPLNLTDGRQLVLPVEEIDIKSPEFIEF